MSTIDSLTRTNATRLLRRPREAVSERRWVQAAVIALLAFTAVAYLWDLGASGNANSFYAATVQAATKSWKAFFFGSLDSSSFITTDKPPASIWVMARRGGASASAAGACSCRRRSRASRRSASSTPR
jgi:4-amino-4-deoxy-L-arabinose transferase-like glycosyltransferase